MLYLKSSANYRKGFATNDGRAWLWGWKSTSFYTARRLPDTMFTLHPGTVLGAKWFAKHLSQALLD